MRVPFSEKKWSKW